MGSEGKHIELRQLGGLSCSAVVTDRCPVWSGALVAATSHTATLSTIGLPYRITASQRQRMEAFKALIASKTVREKHVDHKDKLLQTKLREREVKDALKQQRQHHKDVKDEERLEAAEANRFERAFFHNSKRAVREDREKHKREEHDKSGFTCEHGVWRCRICQPLVKHK